MLHIMPITLDVGQVGLKRLKGVSEKDCLNVILPFEVVRTPDNKLIAVCRSCNRDSDVALRPKVVWASHGEGLKCCNIDHKNSDDPLEMIHCKGDTMLLAFFHALTKALKDNAGISDLAQNTYRWWDIPPEFESSLFRVTVRTKNDPLPRDHDVTKMQLVRLMLNACPFLNLPGESYTTLSLFLEKLFPEKSHPQNAPVDVTTTQETQDGAGPFTGSQKRKEREDEAKDDTSKKKMRPSAVAVRVPNPLSLYVFHVLFWTHRHSAGKRRIGMRKLHASVNALLKCKGLYKSEPFRISCTIFAIKFNAKVGPNKQPPLQAAHSVIARIIDTGSAHAKKWAQFTECTSRAVHENGHLVLPKVQYDAKVSINVEMYKNELLPIYEAFALKK